MNNIQDELEELTFLKDVNIFITEYIPFGTNHIIAFNEELDSQGAIEGGLLTSIIDQEPLKSTFLVEEDLTNVVVKRFDPNDFIQFEAKISYGNVCEIEQDEHFAVHVDASGRVIYGCEMIHLAGEKEWMSLDKLSRVIADLVADSSQMMMNLLSTYQSRLLELVYFERPLNRNKFIILTAKGIKPNESSNFYMDEAAYRNELNQIINQVFRTKDLKDGGKCFFGSEGLILLSNSPEQYEELLSIVGFFQGLDVFQKNYFSKMFMLWDEVRDARNMLDRSGFDPNAIGEAQAILSRISAGVVLMNELLEFMETAVENISKEFKSLQLTSSQQELMEFVDLGDTVAKASIRVKDAALIVAGLKDEIQGVNGLVATLSERQMRQMNEALKDSITSMDEMTRSSERTGVALNILEVVLTGAIAFDVLTLFLGDWPGNSDAFGAWAASNPWIASLVAVTAFLLTGYGILRLIKYLEAKSEPNLRVALKLGALYDITKFDEYVASIDVKQEQETFRLGNRIHEYIWDDDDSKKWLGNEAGISMHVDVTNRIILSIYVNIDSPKKITTKQASDIMLNELVGSGVISEDIFKALK